MKLHQEDINCVLQRLTSQQSARVDYFFLFLNLTGSREVKAELWKVIRPQHGINKRRLFLQENTEEQAEDKELLLTQLPRPHADFLSKGRKSSHHWQTERSVYLRHKQSRPAHQITEPGIILGCLGSKMFSFFTPPDSKQKYWKFLCLFFLFSSKNVIFILELLTRHIFQLLIQRTLITLII